MDTNNFYRIQLQLRQYSSYGANNEDEVDLNPAGF